MDAIASDRSWSSSLDDHESWGVISAESIFPISPAPSTEIQSTPGTFQGMTGSLAVTDFSCHGNLAGSKDVGQSPSAASRDLDTSGFHGGTVNPLEHSWVDVGFSVQDVNLSHPTSGPLLEWPDLAANDEGFGPVAALPNLPSAFALPTVEQQASVPGYITEIGSSHTMHDEFADRNHFLRQSVSCSTLPRKWVNSEDWERHKLKIVRLYFYEKKTLAQVRTIMEEEHGLHATLKMYRDRLKKWECKKNLRWQSVQDVTRLLAKRDAAGKTSGIRWNGVDLDRSRLTRHLKRSGKACLLRHESHEDDVATDMDTCLIGTFRVTTPPPQLCPPDEMKNIEEVLDSLRTWVQGNFENLSWTIDTTSWKVENARKIQNFPSIGTFITSLYEGLSQLDQEKSLRDAFRWLDLAFELLKDAIREESPVLVSILLLQLLLLLREGGRGATVGHMLLNYVGSLMPLILGSNHPVARTWQVMRKILECPQYRNQLPILLRVISDQTERFAGLHNYCVVTLLQLYWLMDDYRSLSPSCPAVIQPRRSKLELQRWLRSIESGSTSCAAPIVTLLEVVLAGLFYHSGEYERAEELYERALCSQRLSTRTSQSSPNARQAGSTAGGSRHRSIIFRPSSRGRSTG